MTTAAAQTAATTGTATDTTLDGVGRELAARLAPRFSRAGYVDSPRSPAPRVAVLGTQDMLAWERSAPGEPGEGGSSPGHRDATVHVTAQAVLVGPWGPTGACGHCLAGRRQRLRPSYERDSLEVGSGTRRAGQWPVLSEPLVAAVWSCYRHALLEPAASSVAAARPALPRVSSVDARTLLVTTGLLLREPLCPSCARTGPQPPDLVELAVRRKPAPTVYRLRAPEDYDLPAAALANPVCGALGPAAVQIPTSPTTAPVAGGVLVRGMRRLHDLDWSGQSTSFAASTRLGFIEGLERHAGSRRNRPGVVFDSYDNLGERAMDPRDCGSYAPSVYECDDRLVPFDPARPLRWVAGYSLRDERPVLVPAGLVYYSWDGSDVVFVHESSSGCASGSCLEEAILFGLLEVIERDAFLLGWYGGAELPEIDPDGAGARIRAMIDRAGLQGYRVRLFDNRIDLPVPVVTAVASRRDGGPGLFSFAAGASLDPGAAIESALSEILTYIPAMPRQVRERRAELERMAQDYTLVRSLPDHAGLFGLPEMAEHARRYTRATDPRPVADLYEGWLSDRPATADLSDDVRYCAGFLAQAGFDTVVVDQSTPEQLAAGLSSVRVIVPGLVPLDFGWAGQRALRMPRMFTALRRAGMRQDDLTEAGLHRVPHPFP